MGELRDGAFNNSDGAQIPFGLSFVAIHSANWQDFLRTLQAQAGGEQPDAPPPQQGQDALVNDLLTSQDRFVREAGERLRSLLQSTDRVAQADGRTLLSMLGNQDQREHALTILQAVPDAGRHQLLEIYHNPAMSNARDYLMRQLGNPEGQWMGVYNLLALLTSENGGERASGGQLLQMLNRPGNDQTTAGSIINNFDSASIHHLMEMRRDPARRQVADFLVTLSATEPTAANNLVGMLHHPDGAVRAGGNALLRMLESGNERQQDVALTLLSVADHRQRQQMLAVLRDNPRAASQILQMLRSDDNGTLLAGHRILEMLVSDHQHDRQQATQIVEMLNNPALAGLTRRAVTAVSAPDHLQHLLAIIRQGLGQAAEQMLSILEGNSVNRETARRQEGVERILNGLSSNDPAERRNAEQLVMMLNTPGQQEIAVTLLSRLEDPRLLRQMLDLRAEAGQEAAFTALVGMLNGDQRQRAAAIGFLQFRAEMGPQSNNARLLLEMLTDPARRGEAVTILNGIDSSRQISAFLDAINRPGFANARAELLRMLGSSNYNDREAALAFVNLLGRRAGPQENRRELGERQGRRDQEEPPGNERLVEQLLSMLNRGGQEANEARLLLTHVRNGQDLARLLDMRGQEQNRDLYRAIVELLRTDVFTGAGIARLQSPQQMREALRILNANGLQPAAERLRSLLSDQQGIGAQRLLELLTSGNAAERALGNQALEALNGNDNWYAVMEALQERRVGQAEARGLLRLSLDPRMYPAVDHLTNLLGSCEVRDVQAARAFLNHLGSSEPATQQAALWCAGLLGGSAQERAMAANMIAGFFSAQDLQQLHRLQGDRAMQGAWGQLSEMLRTTDDRLHQGIRSLLAALGSGNDTSRESARRVLRLLQGNAQEQQRARNILRAAATPAALDRLMSTLTNPHGQVEERLSQGLLAMLNGSDQTEQKAVRNLMLMLTARDESLARPAHELRRMLTSDNAEERANALAILGHLNDPQACAQFLAFSQSEQGRRTAGMLLAMLRSGDQQQVQSAQAFADFLSGRRLTRPEEDRQLQAFLTFANNPENEQLTRLALRSIRSPDHVPVILGMVANPQYRDSARQLIEMIRSNPSQANALLERGFLGDAPLNQLFSLLRTPGQQERGQALLSMLTNTGDDAGRTIFTASTVLRYLASQNPQERRFAEAMLALVGDHEQSGRLDALARLRPAEGLALARIFADENQRTATDALLSLLSSEERADVLPAQNLLILLASSNAEQQAQGRRLLAMLNNSRQQGAAIRELRRMNFLFGGGPVSRALGGN